jgi:hypothetical protein
MKRDKKLQVFISSTFIDLKEERQAAVEAILSSGHIPAGMELFSAGDESQMTVIERWIDESDVYLLILGGRYGSIDKKSGKSYTQLEYEYAIKINKPLFAVVISENSLEEKVKAIGSSVFEKENPRELKEFRNFVCSNLVKFWDDKKDIKLAIHETISEFLYRKELTGWIRGDNSVNTGFLAEEIARLTKENSELREKLSISESNPTASYSTLTYSQVEKLLKSEEIILEGRHLTLFDYFLENSKVFADGVYITSGKQNEIQACDKLILFKLLRITDRGKYFFSDDGHNFFLKATSLLKK